MQRVLSRKKQIYIYLSKSLFNLSLYVKGIFWLLSYHIIVKFFITTNKVSDDNSIKKNQVILCINTEKIGDTFLTLDFINSISKSNNDKKCYYLIQDYLCPLLRRVEVGCTLIPWNKNKYKYNLGYRIKFLEKLRKLNINIAINISPERGIVNDELTLLSNAKFNIALNKLSPYLPSNISERNNKYYDKILVVSSDNVYDNLMNGLSQIGSSKYIVCENQFNLIIPKDLKIETKDNIICVAPYASETSRSWNSYKFSKLCSLLSKEYSIILLGDNKQRNRIEEIRAGNNNIKNYAGSLALEEALSVIAISSLFIGNDSGLTHIALFLKIPLVAIIGGGKNEIFFPYRTYTKSVFLAHQLDCFKCNWWCKFDQKYCLTELTVENVFDNCMKLLKQNYHK